MYPPNWPKCQCGAPVLDGHLTCGNVACGTQAEAAVRQTFAPGDTVWWTRTSSGGYGFSEQVPAVVVRTTETNRVTIDAERKDGTTKRVAVRVWKLKVRS